MPTLHLVFDEVVPVDKSRFRVRVWREAGVPPVVLSSQLRAQPPAEFYSSRLANLVVSSYLGYALPLPVFFELSIRRKQTRAYRVRFETIGCDLRPILHNPTRSELNPPAFAQLFGVPIDSLF
jgi:hypothetical protein